MPTIYDNIESSLLDGLLRVLPQATRASLCIGYLNLRGWESLAKALDHLPGGDERHACRVLVGMYRPPEEEMRQMQAFWREDDFLDGSKQALLKRRITQGFKEQIEFGVPSAQAQETLRHLARQLRQRKVLVRLFLGYPLHAKLYLIERADPVTPLIGFLGSSNLTLAGLSRQGELNVDVVEQDAARKLLRWFDERWNDRSAIDLTDQLAELIENSWACVEAVRPYLVYLKIAYYLSEEARQGEREVKLPAVFQDVLLDFQKAAVTLAVRKLYRRGGVLLGDVVGLGKTLMATAIARVLQEDNGDNTLVICPPKLVPMWEWYLQEYQILGRVLSLGRVTEELPNLPRYRLVIVDESHNLRNREGKRYQAIREYIEQNESRLILLTATPYNKQYTDISNQLRLFLDENQDLRIRPERYFQWLAEKGETEADFIARFQTSPRSLRAFEQSYFPEDWQDLMRLFLVRRTRQFIIKHYAKFDAKKGRYYVWLNGQPSYFPRREPKRVTFPLDEANPNDPYARLLREEVVEAIERLNLPRYGLANYLKPGAGKGASAAQKRIVENLNRAGRRLIGFSRTNLFKRLESSGHSFLLSVRRHILRNLITLYAFEHQLPIPIGTQDAALLDTALRDSDEDLVDAADGENSIGEEPEGEIVEWDPETYWQRAAEAYEVYRKNYRHRFDWLEAGFFQDSLARDLRADVEQLLYVLQIAGRWDPATDAKLQVLIDLVTKRHPQEKLLIFTQFADTALYLYRQLQARGVADVDVLTNQVGDPVTLARRFSPSTNGGLRAGERELRVLIATDVLAEGQNLQDAHIVVNYDLPWAIVRLIQRAGRVDRIGQKHDTILVYSFLPAEGVERIIRLRRRLSERLQQNQEVIGADESFFGEEAAARLRDLYTEKAGALDDEGSDEDIDLESLALQVWNSASKEDQNAALRLPLVVSTTRKDDRPDSPAGLVTYLRYPDGTDALIRVDQDGQLVSQSLSAIFRDIACAPETPPMPQAENHYELIERCVELAMQEQADPAGRLGSSRSVRRKVWERMIRYSQTLTDESRRKQLEQVLDCIQRYPLKTSAQDAIRRQIRLGISDEALLDLLRQRLENETLCEIPSAEEQKAQEPKIICAMGLRKS